jgi:hypothetical protein
MAVSAAPAGPLEIVRVSCRRAESKTPIPRPTADAAFATLTSDCNHGYHGWARIGRSDPCSSMKSVVDPHACVLCVARASCVFFFYPATRRAGASLRSAASHWSDEHTNAVVVRRAGLIAARGSGRAGRPPAAATARRGSPRARHVRQLPHIPRPDVREQPLRRRWPASSRHGQDAAHDYCTFERSAQIRPSLSVIDNLRSCGSFRAVQLDRSRRARLGSNDGCRPRIPLTPFICTFAGPPIAY